MAFPLSITPSARKSIRTIPDPKAGKELRKVFGEIAADPAKMTRDFTHGRRLCDGMVMGSDPFYFQIYFHFAPDSKTIIILAVHCQQSSGPH